MEQLLYSIALRYGKGKITEAGLNYASKLLGIEPSQNENVEYTYGMPFQGGNPMNMFKRAGVRLGANTLMKGAGSSLLPFAGITGLAMLGNKYRKQLTGYDTQAAYEAARDQRIADKRLNRITDRMTSGKDYGNYEEALLDSGAGAIKIDDTIYSGPDYQGGDNNNNGGTNNTGSKNSQGMTSSQHSAFRMARGGIASL